MKYVGVTDAQKLLACNTYFRRGSLVALLGLSDEDDDGEKVIQVAPKPIERTDPLKALKEKLAQADTKEKVTQFTSWIMGNDKLTQAQKDILHLLATEKNKTL